MASTCLRFWVGVALMAACDPGVDLEPENMGTDASDSASGERQAPKQSLLPANCSIAEQGIEKPGSVADQKRLLFGRWIYCEGAFLFGPTGNAAVGIEFAVDGTWYMLRHQEAGPPIRATGFDGSGTWDVGDNGGGAFQTNLTINTGGMNFLHTTFSISPRKMRIVWTGGQTTYVAE